MSRWRKRLFIKDLRLLNDTLATTPLADFYWVWGGLLIGWAREGSVLAHDCSDADFAMLTEDLPRLEQAVPTLVAAGFKPLHRFFNNAGRTTEYCFVRHGAKFEFFMHERACGRLRYHTFSIGSPDQGPIQAVASIPDQPITTFSFVARTWRKHADHDAELTEIYGDWRTPEPDWSYIDDRAIDELDPWVWGAGTRWFGEFGDALPRLEL